MDFEQATKYLFQNQFTSESAKKRSVQSNVVGIKGYQIRGSKEQLVEYVRQPALRQNHAISSASGISRSILEMCTLGPNLSTAYNDSLVRGGEAKASCSTFELLRHT